MNIIRLNYASRLPALLALLALLVTPGCDSVETEGGTELATIGVYVANQGNFTDANGSVTVYDTENRTASTILEDLGSTVQSLFLRDGRLFVLANSAGRIEVVPLDGGPASDIEGVLSPRYMIAVTDEKAYVTSLFGAPGAFDGGNVIVVDLETHQVAGSIAVGDNPEGIAVLDTLAFVANNGFGSGRTVSVIDIQSDRVVETVDVDCDGPRFVLADEDREVWVLCTGRDVYNAQGELVEQTNGAIRILSSETWEILERIELDAQISTVGPGQDAALSVSLGQLFVVIAGHTIYRYDTRANERIAEIGPLEGDPIGAVAYDNLTERIYVARVPGFTEAGRVTVLNLRGEEVESFTTGVSPTYITFRRQN